MFTPDPYRFTAAAETTTPSGNIGAPKQGKNVPVWLLKERAMDYAINAMAMVDLEGKLLYANGAARKLWGSDGTNAIVGMRVLDFWLDRRMAQEVLETTIRTGAWSGEVAARRRDGSRLDVKFSVSLICDNNGAPLGIFASCIDITGRKRAAQELLRSEERYRRIAEAVTDYIYTVMLAENRPPRSVSCPACEALTGYTAAEFDADPDFWTEITVEEDRASVRTHAERLFLGDDPGPIQHRIRRKDGNLRWINRLPVLHHGPEGAVTSLDVLVRDITDRKQANEALRESEARFRDMADLLPQPLFEADLEGRITFANRAGYRMFGYTDDDVRGGVRTIDMLVSEDRDRGRENILRILRGGTTFGNEHTALRKDGTTFPAIIFSAPILRTGRPAGFRGIIVDISERVQAEEVLRETALKFRQLAEAISEVYFIKDVRTRRTLYISPACETVWGKSCQSFYDNPESFQESVHPEDRDKIADVLKLQGQGIPTCAEYRIIRPEGAVRWVRSKTFPVRNSGGALYRIAGVAEDITERKEAEEHMLNHAAQLQALSSRLVEVRETERRSIARELHDEIGQLGTGLKLGLDLLANAASGEMRAQVNHLQVLAGELIAEVRNLSLGLRPSMLDDLGLLPALSWLFKRSQDQTGIIVEFTHRGISRRFLPDVETAVYRTAQEAITNAARYADVSLLFVTVTADAKTITLTVADQGRGFDPETVLARPESTGLFGMRERVDSIGGILTITSAPGAGTSITILLPITERTTSRTDHEDHDHHS